MKNLRIIEIFERVYSFVFNIFLKLRDLADLADEQMTHAGGVTGDWGGAPFSNDDTLPSYLRH